MSESNKPNLPIKVSSFPEIRCNNLIYVDKTEQIAELASHFGRFLFFRPPAFGKTLLLSTLESLFSCGLRDFSELAIEHLWKDEKTYHVIRLDFSVLHADAEEKPFEEVLTDYLAAKLIPFGFTPKTSGHFFFELDCFLAKQPIGSMVLLVDNFDAPLMEALNNRDELDKVWDAMDYFFSIVKSEDQTFRFIFLAGMMPLHRGFEGLDQFQLASLWPQFATLMGFTLTEIKKFFKVPLEAIANERDIPVTRLLEIMTNDCGKFCFDAFEGQTVFHPSLVLDFLTQSTESTGLNGIDSQSPLASYLESHWKNGFSLNLWGKHPFPLEWLEGSQCFENLSSTNILLHQGVLTLKDKEGGLNFAEFPNLRAFSQPSGI